VIYEPNMVYQTDNKGILHRIGLQNPEVSAWVRSSGVSPRTVTVGFIFFHKWSTEIIYNTLTCIYSNSVYLCDIQYFIFHIFHIYNLLFHVNNNQFQLVWVCIMVHQG
jgi:hypothetical protein